MPISYPAGLPTVLASKRTSKAAAFSVASPRRGTPYVEPTGTDTPTVFDVEWLLNEADAAALVNWVEVTLERGTLEFAVPLRTETGLREITGNFLPDGLLDRSRDGQLWRYRAAIVSRTGTGALIVPAPPPPPPPPPPSASGFFVSPYLGEVVFTAGEGGANVTTELLAAVAEANARGFFLSLPPWTVRFQTAFKTNKIKGVRGRSKLEPVTPFDYSPTFASEFIITNQNVSQGFDAATADDVVFRDFELNLTPTVSNAMIGMLGIKRGLFTGLRLIANRNIVSSKAVPVGSLLDLYCTNRNVEVYDNDFDNTTGAYGNLGRIGPDGGACMWVRNLRGGTVGQAEAFASENITVHHNRMRHMTSDEVIAVFGVRGIVRKVQIHNNVIKGLPSIDGVHHATFVSVFPLNDGSALGATAATYDCDYFDNDIEDAAAMYDVLRIGNSADASNPCYNNRSRGNRVRWIRSSDAVTGPKAVWVAEGSVGVDPDVASAIVRCVEGTFGAAYFSDSSGNTSTDDVAICQGGGATSAAGFSGFQKLVNPTAYGDIFNVAFNCRMVEGGTLEGFARIFYNCQKVNGTRYRKNGAGGVVCEIDSGSVGVFTMTNTEGETFGGFMKVAGSVPNGSIVNAFANVCAMSGGASYFALENQSTAGGLLIARNNTTRGTLGGITTGSGTITRAGNYWSGTTD